MEDIFSKSVAILRSSPEKGDEEVYRRLVADGIDSHLAGQLVVFLPMVYCRILLADSGAKFSPTFCRRLPDGQISPEQPFSVEPLWNAAFEFASAEVKRGVSAKDLLAVAGRSAEFDAANQLLKKGSYLKDIVFVPPVLILPENEPTPTAETPAQD